MGFIFWYSRMKAAASEKETAFRLDRILRPYLLRALAMIAIATVAGSVLYRWGRKIAVPRLLMDSLAASRMVFAAGWIVIGAEGWIAYLGPLIVFGLPASLWQAKKHRSARGSPAVPGLGTRLRACGFADAALVR
jgi:hypothetical protein